MASALHAVPEGFAIRDFTPVTLEPELYPAAITVAAGGDVYISSDKNGSLGHGKERGRILRARDTNNDGVADEMIEYAKVDSPRGGHMVGGILYLVHPPLLSALRDKNGDGVADERKVLVQGLGGGIEHPRGADHTTNACRMGIDGWLYIAVGDFGLGIEKEKAGAKGTDGKRLTLYGGGVVRVRPDGTELEVVATMTRNQYDVAISPTLDLFARDNTNDGKGWNTRFHHHTALANHGYPRLYQNFAAETTGYLADYGGGSGTGALWLSEPGFPASWGETLFTCDWTTGNVHHHPLKPFEATFVAEQGVFRKVRHAVDIDVDGSSRLYIADWRAGGYDYRGPGKPQGMVQQVVATSVKPHVYTDVTKAKPDELVRLLASPSAVQRLEASRRILDLQLKAQAPAVLALAADKQAQLYPRVAAIFTYKQLLGVEATPALVRLTEDAAVREFALRALTDRLTQLKGVPKAPFVKALQDASARVRLQAVVGLARLGAEETTPQILEAASQWVNLPADATKGEYLRLPHVTVNALAQLGNTKALLAAVNVKGQRELALRALQMLHQPAVVEGLIALTQSSEDQIKVGALGALARLYYQEKPWNYKDWWSTRPDDRGPYFEIMEWEQTARIHKSIEAGFDRVPKSQHAALLQVLSINRLPLDRLKLGSIDSFQLLLNKIDITPADATVLRAAAIDGKRSWDDRLAAFHAMRRQPGNRALDDTLTVLGVWIKDPALPVAPTQALADFVNDPERGNEVNRIRGIAAKAEDSVARVAWRALLTVLNSPLNRPPQKNRVREEIDKLPREIGFFQAIADLRLSGFDRAIDAALAADNTLLINAAKAAREAGKSVASVGRKVGELPVAEVTALAMKSTGNLELGRRLYVQQGCIACHSIELTAEQKGPYLGAAGAKFERAYLIEAILEPGKVVAQGFRSEMFKMKDGSMKLGFISGEADGVITLRDITGTASRLRREEVVEQTTLPQSLMPAGLAAGLTTEEFVALIDYLTSLRASGG